MTSLITGKGSGRGRGGRTLPFQVFLSFLTFSKPLLLQNRNTSLKIDYGNFKVDQVLGKF